MLGVMISPRQPPLPPPPCAHVRANTRTPPTEVPCYLLVNSLPLLRAIICCHWRQSIPCSQRAEGEARRIYGVVTGSQILLSYRLTA